MGQKGVCVGKGQGRMATNVGQLMGEVFVVECVSKE